MRKLMTLAAFSAATWAVLAGWQDAVRFFKIKMASRHPEYVPAGGRKAYLSHSRDDFDPARRGGPDQPEPGRRAGRR